jgi:mRNA-degrading endonuclease RelE of RelBE toxin-antitoxin system
VAEVRWTRNARGCYLELNPNQRELVGKHAGHLQRFPLLGLRDRSGSDRRLLRVRRYGILYEYQPEADLVIIISIRPLARP